jgi:hypothetical protein
MQARPDYSRVCENADAFPPIHIGGHKNFPAPFAGNFPWHLAAHAAFKLFRFIIHHSAFFISS